MPDDARLLLLNKDDVEKLLNPDDVMQAVREAFVLHSCKEGRVFPVIRESLPGHGVFGIKAGDVQVRSTLGFKAAGFWPNNRQKEGEPHQATVMLIDPATGRPTCLIDGNAITTMRTGAAGGLGLMNLARTDSIRLCVFGTGVQARIQVFFALRLIPLLRQVSYVSWNGQPDEGFERHFEGCCEIRCATDKNMSVAESDIVITATPGGGPLFDMNAVQPGTHLNCVGADTKGKRELPDGLLQRVRLFVDDHDQARQIGETQWAPDIPCTELGDVLTGRSVVTRDPKDITLFDMTGLALQDLTTAHMLQLRAQASGAGTYVAWPW